MLKERNHTNEDLQPQVFFGAQVVYAAHDVTDLVVRAPDKFGRDFVPEFAIGDDSVTMVSNRVGVLLVGFTASQLSVVLLYSQNRLAQPSCS